MIRIPSVNSIALFLSLSWTRKREGNEAIRIDECLSDAKKIGIPTAEGGGVFSKWEGCYHLF